MIIKQADFVCSSSKAEQCPQNKLPEYAFIGRSNVGKSSLINMLTNKKKLAKVSSTPGKTRLINHFLINNSWYIVDLPGYGYAKASKTDRRSFSKIVIDYIECREEMTLLFVLIDSRLEPQKIDIEFINLLGKNGVPFAIIFTKTDKTGMVKLQRNIEAYKTLLMESWEELPSVFYTSSETKAGKDDVLNYIADINCSLAKND
ncbi:MAG: ribosome biogenesis GTP-binding protein YihA/YsxC [Prevotellaceae bacterium]|jgi:GTP-binding protein|nr:ribosome biogenesis GTP-binding protein YihA/YsxC [Prevotellaceae bacterium]